MNLSSTLTSARYYHLTSELLAYGFILLLFGILGLIIWFLLRGWRMTHNIYKTTGLNTSTHKKYRESVVK